MNEVDLLGYAAALLVLATFCMRDMVSLRVLAIASNLAFLGYAALAGIHPVLMLHALLLPMNVWRLVEATKRVSGPRVEPPSSGHWMRTSTRCLSAACPNLEAAQTAQISASLHGEAHAAGAGGGARQARRKTAAGAFDRARARGRPG
jgi:hypothetical protein